MKHLQNRTNRERVRGEKATKEDAGNSLNDQVVRRKLGCEA
ncbi:MAG: hypothetical protein M5U01_37005 [Ardenticatenaceae bacterium]|nr:hypothetical protein [Ardenticatenaceae bacterium]